MLKEISIAVILTLTFSIGVSVLFVRTIMEFIELLINGNAEQEDINKPKEEASA